MGGLAFRSGPDPLHTPRMPLQVYLQVQQQCLKLLQSCYEYVATPIEAPGKEDYGDVDFMVACGTAKGANSTDIIYNALGAIRCVSTGKNKSFAIPWPAGEIAPEPNAAGRETFVQIDVQVCKDKRNWDWELFHRAHGDMWHILGSVIREYGLKIDDKGLHLRIEEIELISRKKSLILLSDSHKELLEFLGLDGNRFWKQFESIDDMFEYMASCRFFRDKNQSNESNEDEVKLNDGRHRKGMTRPIYKKWIEEFVPKFRSSGRFNRELLSREQVRGEAFDHFGVENTYNQTLDSWRRQRQKDEFWSNLVKKAIPIEDVPPHLRAAAIRGLKAIIMENDESYGITPPKPLKLANGLFDEKEAIDFAERSWKVVGEAQLRMSRDKTH